MGIWRVVYCDGTMIFVNCDDRLEALDEGMRLGAEATRGMPGANKKERYRRVQRQTVAWVHNALEIQKAKSQ